MSGLICSRPLAAADGKGKATLHVPGDAAEPMGLGVAGVTVPQWGMIGWSAAELNKQEGSGRASKHTAPDIYRNALDGGEC